MPIQPSDSIRKVASGWIHSAPCIIYGGELVGGSAPGLINLRNGSTTGTLLIEGGTVGQITAGATTPLVVPAGGVNFSSKCYATLSGTSARATVYFRKSEMGAA